MLSTLERNKGFTVILLGGAILLLILVTAGLDGQVLVFETPDADTEPMKNAAVDHYQELFTHEYYTNFIAGEKSRDAFATSYFNKPAPKPKPKPPGTRTVSLVYMGSMENSRGEVTVFMNVDDQLKKLMLGENIIADWQLATVSSDLLTLTNSAPSTNSVGFKKTLKLNIPIR